jgi:hypothetical protein
MDLKKNVIRGGGMPLASPNFLKNTIAHKRQCAIVKVNKIVIYTIYSIVVFLIHLYPKKEPLLLQNDYISV